MTSVLAPERPATTKVPRRRWLPTAAIIVVAIALVAVGIWIVLAADSDPQVTFDGTQSDYSGPTTFTAGEIVVTVDITGYDTDVAFIAVEVVDESMTFGDDVRTWHEHENPFDLVAGILKDRDLRGGRIGIEETVRHFIVDGRLRRQTDLIEQRLGRGLSFSCGDRRAASIARDRQQPRFKFARRIPAGA